MTDWREQFAAAQRRMNAERLAAEQQDAERNRVTDWGAVAAAMVPHRPATDDWDWDDLGDCVRDPKWRATCHDTWGQRSRWCPACLARHPDTADA